MTGTHITVSNPVAFFAVAQSSYIPFGGTNTAQSHLMQQLAPVNTWGKNFFVPVSNIERDIVRIVASQNNTKITQTGGTIRTGVPGAQTDLDSLQAGQFVELEILLPDSGCYIEADKPVGICSYLANHDLPAIHTHSSQCWIPAIEQSVFRTQIAPFISYSHINILYYALVFTPIGTKDSTKVAVGELPPTNLTGGSWIDNATANMSFYSVLLDNDTVSYTFTNPAGLGVDMDSIEWYINRVKKNLPYNQLEWNETFSVGEYEIRMWVRFENEDTISKTGILKIHSCGQSAVFYANNVYYANLPHTTICTKDVNFRAEIEGEYTEIRWYIDEEEYEPENPLDWYENFETGEYEIKMVTLFDNGETVTLVATLKIQIFWIKIKNIRY